MTVSTITRIITAIISSAALSAWSTPVFSSTGSAALTDNWLSYLCIAIFVVAYVLVILEENLHLRKSKPMLVAAGLVWILVAIVLQLNGDTETARQAVTHNLLEYGELFLFLLAAMAYINAMDERGVFDALRAWLVNQGFSLRTIYWLTGGLAFVISPVADNLTTALLMATVVMAVGGTQTKFVTVGCINIVVAANAGGAFSPFGDITTLMVWQKGILPFQDFFALFVPSLINWLIPAAIMFAVVPKGKPEAMQAEAQVLDGAWVIAGMFLLTIAMAVSSHNFLHMPPVLGMMTGLGFLKIYAYFLQQRSQRFPAPVDSDIGASALELEGISVESPRAQATSFDIFKSLERAEWDTLMFFYGIILCVGGLGTLGYLTLASEVMYGDWGPTAANISVGFFSALIDNIPVMFAVLSMSPDMNSGQWLLVTLTAGVGGSMLSIGSAAGVAVMGQARGVYTFFAHLKWSWAIALGYGAAIWAHFLINADTFN